MGNFSILTSLTLNSAGFNKGLDDANNKIKKFGTDTSTTFGGIKGAALFLTGAIAGLYGVMASGKAVIASSDALSDSFETTLGGVTNAVTYLKTSIATLDFSNFIQSVKDAIDAGSDYIATLDEIGMMTNASAIIESKNRRKIAQLQILTKDPSKSLQERIGYQRELLNLKKQESDYNLEIANKEYNNEFNNASKLTGGKLKPNQIESMLQDPLVNQKMIKDANVYNQKLAEYKSLNKTIVTQYGSTIEKTKEERAEIKKLGVELKNTSPEVKKYAEQLNVFGGRLNGDQYNKLTDAIVKKGEAEAKYDEETKKNQIALAKLNKGIIDLDEKEYKNGQEEFTKKLSSYEELKSIVAELNVELQNMYASGNKPSEDFLNNLKQQEQKLIDIENAVQVAKNGLESYIQILDDIDIEDNTDYSVIPDLEDMTVEPDNTAAEIYQARIDEINNITKNGLNDLAGTFSQGIANMITGDAGLGEFFASLLGSIGGFLKQMGSAIVSYGIAMEAFKKAFANPYVAIAAGIALMITGGIVSNYANQLATNKFANGGIVGGNSFSGDMVMARVNSGEMVLNRSQQANLFKMANNGGLSGGQVEFVIRGDKLVGSLNNYSKKRSNSI